MQLREQRILILGATGMLGSTLLRNLSTRRGLDVHATVRDAHGLEKWFRPELHKRIHTHIDAAHFESVARVLDLLRPDLVINCIGVIKQLAAAKDPLTCISINALFPHRLARECAPIGARLIHISTDCVFSGKNGGYVESDFPDCDDLYGRTKLLGEVDYPHAVTLRTSIIGHELKGHLSLVDWFMAQQGRVRGYVNAIYSGFPTVEMARIIGDHVLPNHNLSGLYHVSSEPISKYELLRLISEQYGKEIEIEPYHDFHCDRSLDSTRFRQASGYVPPAWPELVEKMHAEKLSTSQGSSDQGRK